MKRQSAFLPGLILILATGAANLAALPARAESVLIMFEEAGCIWCARWNREIAPIYPKTPEGQAAPLRRVDLHGPMPEGVTFSKKIAFSPTFVLVDNDNEVGRIEGYPGEDFFWGLLGQMLREAGIAYDRAG